MKLRSVLILPMTLLLFLAAGCDNGAPATPATSATATSGAVVTVVPTSAGAALDTAVVPSPTTGEDAPASTPVTATAKGQAITPLAALVELKPKALAWQADARLVMLANVRPGQASKLLGVALGDPDVNESTPGGVGRNWALIAFSPSTKGAIALTIDGAQTDLVKEGALTDNMVEGFGSPAMSALALSQLDPAKLADPVKLTAAFEAAGQPTNNMGLAMFAPDGLGMGPLPTPQSGGSSPNLVYELFSVDPTQQRFIIYDATNGAVILDSAKP